MGCLSPKQKLTGCISNALKNRLVAVATSAHSGPQTPADRQANLDHQMYEHFRPRTSKEVHEYMFRLDTSRYNINKVLPGSYSHDLVCFVLTVKRPLDVTILYEKEPNSQKFEILMHIENQADLANVRKCVWEDENNQIRISDLAGPDPWRLSANYEQRNYPIGKKCLVCHCAVRCKKDCVALERDGGYAEE